MSSPRPQDRASLCRFTFADGRQCRTPRCSGHLHLCCFHAQKEAESLAAIATLDLANLLDTEEGSSLWETWLLASKLTLLIEQCIATAEPAYLAKYAFQLAQQFNNFYHRHHVLHETDPTRKALLFATAAVAQREMTRALGYLGIEAPPVM